MNGWQISKRTCRWCGSLFVRPPEWPWICPTPACLARCQAFGIQVAGKWWYLPVPLGAEMMEAHAPITPEQDQISHILMGGAAGASKSTSARFGAYWFAMTVPKCRILLLREVAAELERSHILGLMDVEAEQIGAAFRSHPYPLARWENGSFIEGGHMEDAEAVKRYLSSEYDLIIAEEATLYDPDALLELSTRARTTNPAMQKRGGARVWMPTNPGGPSTTVLRDLFIDRSIDAEEWPSLAAEYRAHEWMFVPGRLDDNPYMDASYERKLATLRQQWRYKQLRFGDWYAVSGLFFDTFSTAIHVEDIEIGHPERQQWFRSLDWGYKDRAVMGFWVVLDDGHLHMAAELAFTLHTAEEITPKIFALDDELRLPPERRDIKTHASPDMWGRRGQVGEYIAQTAARLGWPCTPAKTDREGGWMRVQSLLRVDHRRRPGISFNPRCRYTIKSLLTAQSDKDNPNDVAQKDDHALEMLRYAVMSRPRPRALPDDHRRGEFDDDFAPAGAVRVGASQTLR